MSEVAEENHNHTEHQEEHPVKPQRESEGRRPRRRIDARTAELLRSTLEELTGTRAAYLMKEGGEIIGKVPIREIFNALRELQADILVLDGEADQRLVNFASQRGIKMIAAMRATTRSVPENIQIITPADL